MITKMVIFAMTGFTFSSMDVIEIAKLTLLISYVLIQHYQISTLFVLKKLAQEMTTNLQMNALMEMQLQMTDVQLVSLIVVTNATREIL